LTSRDKPVIVGCKSIRSVMNYLNMARLRIEHVLNDERSGRIRLAPRQKSDLEYFSAAIKTASNNEFSYIICDNEEGSGDLTRFVNCVYMKFVKGRAWKRKRADALIHVGRCSIITFEHTVWSGKAESFEKFSDTALAQVSSLHWLYKQLVENNMISVALRSCASINQLPSSLEDYYTHGGLAVIAAPFSRDFIQSKTYNGLLVKNPPRKRRRKLRGYLLQPYTNPYVVLVETGILQYLS